MAKNNKIALIVLFFVLGVFSCGFCEESITITTYYPSPYGSYNELTTTGNTYLATDSGNVGVGTTSPSYGKLEVQQSGGGTAGYFSTTNGNPGFGIQARASGSGTVVGGSFSSSGGTSKHALWLGNESGVNNYNIFSYGTAKSYFAGNVGIGTQTPGYLLTCNGQPGANGYTTWTNYSDSRLKENIKGIEDGTLDKIMQLKPSTFNYNEKYYEVTGYGKEKEARKLCGFVAQEIKEVFPDMVTEKELSGEKYLDSNLTNLQVYLVKAIQEQQKEIEALKQEISKLNAPTELEK